VRVSPVHITYLSHDRVTGARTHSTHPSSRTGNAFIRRERAIARVSSLAANLARPVRSSVGVPPTASSNLFQFARPRAPRRPVSGLIRLSVPGFPGSWLRLFPYFVLPSLNHDSNTPALQFLRHSITPFRKFSKNNAASLTRKRFKSQWLATSYARTLSHSDESASIANNATSADSHPSISTFNEFAAKLFPCQIGIVTP